MHRKEQTSTGAIQVVARTFASIERVKRGYRDPPLRRSFDGDVVVGFGGKFVHLFFFSNFVFST
jgi:hypothetical protein